MKAADAAQRFEPWRALLVRHAYRMLGSYADAEDATQDAFLRFDAALGTAEVRDDRAFLRATVTRLCLDKLRSAQARREQYVGPWLPELVVDSDPAIEHVELADDISFALLLALERLAPLERAAFLLHDALGVPFDEVAATLGRTEAAVRKLASRARRHVHDERRERGVPRAEALRVRDAFLDALRRDDPAAMEHVLAGDVMFTSDGGGVVAAATVPVFGRDRVTRLLFGLLRKGASDVRRVEIAMLNALPGIIAIGDHEIISALALEVADGRIASIYVMRNPQKLRTLAAHFKVGQ